jgi:hypothetical protein
MPQPGNLGGRGAENEIIVTRRTGKQGMEVSLRKDKREAEDKMGFGRYCVVL